MASRISPTPTARFALGAVEGDLLRARARPSFHQRQVAFKRSQSNVRDKPTAPCVTSNLRQIFDRTDDLIGKAVVDRLGCRHPVIPVGVFADPLDRLSGLAGDDLAQT